jgi:hypothetical protein
MKLSAVALDKINKTPTRLKLALELGCTERWISRLIKDNDPNSDLTLSSALKIIREETGLSDDEILETEVTTNEG